MTTLDPAAIDVASLPPLPPSLGPLNPAQHAAVVTTGGPLLILAGAGSGKTRVLTRRIAWLLDQGADPEAVLAVTFTNKAAAEMRGRVEELVGGAARKVWMNTFHSACVRILRIEAERLGYTRRFAIYDDDDQQRIIRQAIRDLGYDPKEVPARRILSAIDGFKNRMLTLTDVVRDKRASASDPVVRVWEVYEDALRTADALDFNDLIGHTARLFAEHPEALQTWRARFQHVLVDEYQDTNRAQYRLLRLLAEEHRNLSVVGDDDQSIYGFRGADISNIHDFERDFPDATVIRLEQNYRCGRHILSLANAVIAKAEQRIGKALWTERCDDARVRFLAFDDARAEARGIAAIVRDLRERDGRDWSDFAIIYRTNATSQPFEAAFREAHIPYKVVGGRQFYARREIRDTLAYLRLLVHPTDDAACLRILNVPPRDIGAKTVQSLRDEAGSRGDALLTTARGMASGSGRVARALEGFVQLIDGLLETAANASLPALVQETLVRTGYLEMLAREGDREASGREENLQQLMRDAAAFDPEDPLASPMERLGAWLDRIALTGADEELPEGGEVVLTTVHTAKGLEYPVVFVVSMVEGRFPHQRSLDEARGVDEERRLAYVAFTRAEHRLFVSRIRMEIPLPGRAGAGGGPTPIAPSRFLYGIPADACDGDLPEVETTRPHVQDTHTLRRDAVRDARAALARLLHGAHDDPPEAETEGDAVEPDAEPVVPDTVYRTRPITSLADLAPGVRIVHHAYGAGEVVRVVGARLLVRTARGMATVAAHDPGLALLGD